MRRVVIPFRSSAPDLFLGHASTAISRLLVGAAGLVCLGAFAFVAWKAALLHSELAAIQQSLANAHASLNARLPKATPATPAMRQRVQGLNRIIHQLNTPWSDIFDALEQHAHSEVAIVSIEPDTGKGRVRIEAEAKRLEDLLGYARQLRQSPQFQQIDLVKHEVNERDPGRPFRMSIDVFLGHRGTTSGALSS